MIDLPKKLGRCLSSTVFRTTGFKGGQLRSSRGDGTDGRVATPLARTDSLFGCREGVAETEEETGTLSNGYGV